MAGNYRRHRRHAVGVETDRLRFVVEATNGAPCADLYEVRAYPPAPEGPFGPGDER